MSSTLVSGIVHHINQTIMFKGQKANLVVS